MSNRGATPDLPIKRKERRPEPVRRRKAALSLAEASAGMLVQTLRVRAPDVVFVKGIIEASEGIALLFAERGGELTIAAPLGRGAELAELLRDIALEVGGELGPAGMTADGRADEAGTATAALGGP